MLFANVSQLFGRTPDPDFAEASLLEQYQAQIGSALTPAFAADSSPELAAEAVNVCATFIATGIVTDIDRMGRILKLLVSALENFSGTQIILQPDEHLLTISSRLRYCHNW
jgi:HEAT repeat-containing protein 5